MRTRMVLASVLAGVLALGVWGCGDRAVQEWVDAATGQPTVLVAYGAPKGVSIGALSGEEGVALGEAINGLGFELLRGSALTESDGAGGNVVLSPLSVHAALTMAANGARGSTAEEMVSALGLDTIGLVEADRSYGALLRRLDGVGHRTGTTVTVANSLWPDMLLEIEPEFVEVNRKHFGAQLETLDLADPAAADRMNEWVAEHTGDRITEAVQQPPAPGLLYLINTVYLDADWEHPFEAAHTSDMPFRPNAAEEALVPTMRQSDTFAYTERAGVQAIRLPYTFREVGMWIVLPPERSQDPRAALDEWIATLDSDGWTELTNSAREREGFLALPKLTTRFHAGFVPSLEAAGMREAFQGSADFTGIGTAPIDGEGPYIGGIVQETFLDVHEKGTEAAAATVIDFAADAAMEAPATVPFEMIVDRPFLIAIDLEPEGALLFLGAIYDPR